VADDEIAAVHEIALDRLGPTPLDGEPLRHVVAGIALGLGVTRLAEARFLARRRAVTANEVLIVTQERLRKGAFEISACVTRRARGLFPLLLVLVTREALAHGRQGRFAFFDDAGVALYALSADFGQRQMLVVIESDRPRHARRLVSEHAHHFVRVFLVALAAELALRELVRSVALGNRVARIAS